MKSPVYSSKVEAAIRLAQSAHVRKAINVIAVLVGLSLSASTQVRPHQDSISVAFVIDGKPTPCDSFGVELRFDAAIIKPAHVGQHFDVPDVFKRPSSVWRDDQQVEIRLSCGGQSFVFPQAHSAFLRDGNWELGIARPPFSIERFSHTQALERGAWVSYLIFEGEGVAMLVSQPDPPAEIADSMKKEQSNASGERARNIAYALAVFGVEYEKNRNYLLQLQNNCLARPKDSPENDGCDGELLEFVTNLYWRGDDSLLAPLLQIADTRRDVIQEIGTFYSDLLDRRGVVVFESLEKLPDDNQKLICKLAYDDDLVMDSPKRDRVMAFLKRTGGEVATRCSSAFSGN